ncbi:hypothetical protein SAMN05444156_2141 [Verrucomicrobium sp. GAS474]|uniref:hypothetical protein n=1 Tax=Verrucomicrobium sp. GAS474 TaxID=1882831 RepID=UPI00087A8E53|nr:hypothetical protein [Verrucomicrobium sp. GAS474]SDU13114.1 hypothetical protein SAMN05444156_2141 [Verrucomicrobium sp. GAS474]
MKVAGIVLIAFGALALIYQGFSYTQTKKDAQIGPVSIQHDETKNVWVPPVVGIVCLAAGAGLIVFSPRRA